MKIYNYLTYRAVVISWFQKWVGLAWHLPGRIRNIIHARFRTPMPPDEFKARTDAAISRIRVREELRLAQRQAKADADSAALKRRS